jgi:tetratricopeptide (TPR) repeat protein/predicted Ser/Thr protein kinase
VRQVGRYVIEQELARGGAGVVYRARDPDSGDAVAVKVLLAGAQATVKARKRFQREVGALTRLDHRHVVRVRDAGEQAGLLYMAMDYVRGESLQAKLDRQGPLAVEEAAELTRQVATAVAHAHAHTILHRDLKPANVLVDEEGAALLTDFGLVRELAPSASQTRLSKTGSLLGTPGYWPPEQARGELIKIGPHSDVYGLGALLYALLTGVPPHQADTLAQALDRAERLPTPPHQLRAEIPARLEAIVLRCLQPVPARRPQTAAAVADDLERFLSGDREGVSRAATLVAAGILLAGLAGAATLMAGDRLSTRPPPAPPSATDSSPPTAPPVADVPTLVASALQQFDSEHGWRASLATVTRALTLAPDDARALAVRGMIRAFADQAEAADDLRRAAAAAPTDADSLRALTLGFELLGDEANQATWTGAWARLHPDDPQLLLHRAVRLPGEESLAAVHALVADRPEWVPGLIALGELDYEFQKALPAVERALALEPDNVRALLSRARHLDFLGHADRAAEDYERALTLAPFSDTALLARANYRHGRGHHAEARADLRTLLDAEPRHALAWSLLSEVLEALDLDEAALEASATAYDIDPTSIEVVSKRALLLAWQGQLQDAMLLASKVLDVQRNNPESLWVLGTNALVRGDFDRAQQVFSLAVQVTVVVEKAELLEASLNGQAQALARLASEACQTAEEACELGDLYLHGASLDGAAAAYERALALEPDHPRALASRGLVAARQDEPGAEAQIQRAVALAPDAFWPRLRAAQALLNPGDDAEAALRQLDTLLQRWPGRGPALRVRITIHQLQGDGEAARRDIALAALDEDDPLRSIPLLLRAQEQLRAGDVPGARATLELARRVTPRHPHVHLTLGLVHRLAGQHGQAVEALERALELHPALPSAYELRAKAYEQTGDFGRGSWDARLYRLLEPSPESWRLEANFERRLDKLDDAARCLTQALQFGEPDPALWGELAELSLERGHPQAALEQSQRAVELAPSDPAIGLIRLRVLGELKRTVEALAEIDRILGLEGLSPQVRSQLTDMRARLRAGG